MCSAVQEVVAVAVADGEGTFCDAPLLGVEGLPLVAIVGVGVGVGQSKRTPDAILRGGERHRIVIEQHHRPGVARHRGSGEGGLADLLAVGSTFDTSSDGLGGSVGGKNRVLTPEVSVFACVVVSEGLDIALGVALAPHAISVAI